MLIVSGNDETNSAARGLWLGPATAPRFVAVDQLSTAGGGIGDSARAGAAGTGSGGADAGRLDLAAVRATLANTAPGCGLQQVLEAAPRFPAVGADRDGQLARAQVDVEFLVACQRQIAYVESLAYERTARLGKDYPALREFYEFEVALALGVSEGTAQTRVAEATRLVDDLPATLAAMRSGRLAAGKARTLVRATFHADAVLARRVEAVVLPEAPTLTDAELRNRCAELLIAFDPADAEERRRAARQRRTVKKWHEPDGMANLLVHSTIDDIATIWEALTGLGHAALPTTGGPAGHGVSGSESVADGAAGVAGAGAAERRSLDMGRVDALVDMCADVLAAGGWHHLALHERHGRQPHIQVLMPFDALLGGQSPCELAGYGPITAAQAREIAADATLTRLVCDPLTGQLLDYGRTRYHPPQHLQDFVLARDQRCIAPGCRMPAARCHLDHRIPFGPPAGSGTGGATSADNLAAACAHHHRGKDGGGYHLHRTPDGHHDWTTPLGRTYRRPATPLWKPPPTPSDLPADEPPPF